MMKISTRGRYALRLMIDLAQHQNKEYISLKEISIRQDITFKLFTEGVVQNTDGTIAYNLMQNDMVALRAVMRLGWEIPNPVNAMAKEKAKRFPFAVLTPTNV